MYRRSLTPMSIVFRIVAILYCVYCYLLFPVIPYIRGNWLEGVYWTSASGGSLFPLPHPPGNLPMIVEASPVDAAIYLVLISTGLWIGLLVLAVLYIVSPVGTERE